MKDGIKVLIFIFFISLFLLFFISPMDPDLGWHLKCGENFWSSGSFCSINTFSVLLPGYLWPNHAWLYDVSLYLIYNFGGFFGLSVFNSVIMILSFLFLYFSVKDKKFEKIFLIFLIIVFGFEIFSLGIRSQIFGILFFAIEIFLLLKSKENEKMIFFVPLVFLIWANFHGSVIVGVILFGFFIFRKILFANGNFIKDIGILFDFTTT